MDSGERGRKFEDHFKEGLRLHFRDVIVDYAMRYYHHNKLFPLFSLELGAILRRNGIHGLKERRLKIDDKYQGSSLRKVLKDALNKITFPQIRYVLQGCFRFDKQHDACWMGLITLGRIDSMIKRYKKMRVKT